MPKRLVGDYDACMVVPYGKKCYIWFTKVKDVCKCILLEVDNNRQIETFRILRVRFHDDLCDGTVLYGILQSKNTVMLEDIFMYKGEDVMNKPFIHKLQKLKNIFTKELREDEKNEIYISMIPIYHTYEEVLLKQVFMKYDIYSIKYIQMRTTSMRIITSKYHKELIKEKAIFEVREKDEVELYELYVEHNGAMVFYDYAKINDIKCSKNMEKIFNRSKNDCTNNQKMECIYVRSLGGWMPIKLVENKRITSKNDLNMILKRTIYNVV
jgi:hypothetical protein